MQHTSKIRAIIMAKAGRKSAVEELEVVRRYSELTDDYFRVVKKYLNNKNPADEKWAVEQLSKAFVKMIPQDLTSGGDKLPQEITVRFINGDRDTK